MVSCGLGWCGCRARIRNQEHSDGCCLSGEPRLLLYIAQFNYDFVLSKHIQFLDHNFDIHNETFKYKEFSLTLMFPTIQEMMRWIFPVYQNINDATHEMAEGEILQSLNKHSFIAAGGRDVFALGRFGL